MATRLSDSIAGPASNNNITPSESLDGDGDDVNDKQDARDSEDDDEDDDPAGAEDEDSVARPLQRAKEWRRSTETRRSRGKEKPCVVPALIPGVDITRPGRPPIISALSASEICAFNVGGTMFETLRPTLQRLPHSRLADEAFLLKHFREERGQYFFDRDPEVFGAVLNYLRTGELHLPTKFCGPAIKTELEYWGVDEDEIEECCWTRYSAWTSTLEALRKLERDRKVNMPRSVEQLLFEERGNSSKLRTVQLKGWSVLNGADTSMPSKVYSWISLVFVIVSIFSFIAQTHDFFRVTVTTTITNSNSGHNATLNQSLPVNGTNTTKTDQEHVDSDAHPAMLMVDATCLAFFLTEFLLRVIFSPRRCKILLLPMTIFELLALLPDLIEFGIRLFHPTLRTVSAVDVITFLRLLRVFRILRLMRHFPGLWILFYTLKASIKELLLLLLFLCVGMLFFASLIYYADDRSVFTSIPMACWWSIVTMTTVGYGDMYPRTSLGYVVGSTTAVCGVLVIGFTVPVLVNNFILYYQHTQCSLNREAAKRRRAQLNATSDNANSGTESIKMTSSPPSAFTRPSSHDVCKGENGDRNSNWDQAKQPSIA